MISRKLSVLKILENYALGEGLDDSLVRHLLEGIVYQRNIQPTIPMDIPKYEYHFSRRFNGTIHCIPPYEGSAIEKQ